MKVLRASIALGWRHQGAFLTHLLKSRAIKVNGGGELTDTSESGELKNTSEEFVRILFTGPSRMDHNTVLAKELTIKGLLFPTSVNTGLTHFDWSAGGFEFSVPHPLMCAYYQDQFKRHHWKPFIKDVYHVPESCIDLLARVVAHLSIKNVVCAPVLIDSESTMSKKDFPHEAQIQHAILKKLWNLDFETIMLVNNKQTEGQPDIIAKRKDKTFILELVLAHRGDAEHEEHLLRFQTKQNYSRPTDAKKCILTVGRDMEVVNQRLQAMFTIKQANYDLKNVELLGLAPTAAFCSYTLLHKVDTDQEHTFTVPVDGVSRVIHGSNMFSAVDVIKLVPQKEVDAIVSKKDKQISTQNQQIINLLNQLSPNNIGDTHTYTYTPAHACMYTYNFNMFTSKCMNVNTPYIHTYNTHMIITCTRRCRRSRRRS